MKLWEYLTGSVTKPAATPKTGLTPEQLAQRRQRVETEVPVTRFYATHKGSREPVAILSFRGDTRLHDNPSLAHGFQPRSGQAVEMLPSYRSLPNHHFFAGEQPGQEDKVHISQTQAAGVGLICTSPNPASAIQFTLPNPLTGSKGDGRVYLLAIEEGAHVTAVNSYRSIEDGQKFGGLKDGQFHVKLDRNGYSLYEYKPDTPLPYTLYFGRGKNEPDPADPGVMEKRRITTPEELDSVIIDVNPPKAWPRKPNIYLDTKGKTPEEVKQMIEAATKQLLPVSVPDMLKQLAPLPVETGKNFIGTYEQEISALEVPRANMLGWVKLQEEAVNGKKVLTVAERWVNPDARPTLKIATDEYGMAITRALLNGVAVTPGKTQLTETLVDAQAAHDFSHHQLHTHDKLERVKEVRDYVEHLDLGKTPGVTVHEWGALKTAIEREAQPSMVDAAVSFVGKFLQSNSGPGVSR